MHYIFDEKNAKYEIGKIVCVGRNYAKHIKELNSKDMGIPILFLKPSTAVIYNEENIIIPNYSSDVHHEVELGFYVSKDGKDIPESEAHNYVSHYFLALDMTLRDVQSDAKRYGTPWSIAKGFDTSCPISQMKEIEDFDSLQDIDIELSVNSEVRQSDNTKMMLFSNRTLISFISSRFKLEKGDLILTGTPSGVGKVEDGDVITAVLNKEIHLKNTVVKG